MNLNPFIVAVFCLVDDQLNGRRIRRRRPARKLSDAEVLTIEMSESSSGWTLKDIYLLKALR